MINSKEIKDVNLLPVDVICYGQKQHFDTREDAISYYLDALRYSNGAERERYAQICSELCGGTAALVSDGSQVSRNNENTLSLSNLGSKELVKLISKGVLGIHSPEIYDIGKCTLVKEDLSIIKALLNRQGWYAAQYLRQYIESDKELLKMAAIGGTGPRVVLCYANHMLRDDKSFVMQLIKIDPRNIAYVSHRLANDIEVVNLALSHAKNEDVFKCVKESVGKKLFVDMVKEYYDRNIKKESLDDVIAAAQQYQKNSNVIIPKSFEKER